MKIEQNLKLQIENADYPQGKKKTLITAISLFSTQGYAATSTAKIAKQAGVSEGTIFKYFKTKDRLLNDLLSMIINQLLPFYQTEFVEELSDHNFNSKYDFTLWFVSNRYEFLKSNEELLRIFLEQAIVNPTLRKEILENKINEGNREKLDAILKPLFSGKINSINLMQETLQLLFGYFIEQIIIAGELPDKKNANLDVLAKQLLVALEEK